MIWIFFKANIHSLVERILERTSAVQAKSGKSARGAAEETSIQWILVFYFGNG
jgi:hypothetical protein